MAKSTTKSALRAMIREIVAESISEAAKGGRKATSSGRKAAVRGNGATRADGSLTFAAKQVALKNLKAKGLVPRTFKDGSAVTVRTAIAAGLMTEDGQVGTKAAKATPAKATTAKKAPAKRRTARKATPVAKGDQACKKAGDGTLSRKEWDRTLMTKVRTTGLMVGKKGQAQTLYAASQAAPVWAVVVGWRDEDGVTPNEAFGLLVEATSAREKTAKERAAAAAARQA